MTPENESPKPSIEERIGAITHTLEAVAKTQKQIQRLGGETLHCTVCRKAIPEHRATRITATCSEKCKNRLDQIRINQRRTRKCSYCLHPSTPEEREEFRLWRAERGDIKTAVLHAREHGATGKKEMRAAMREARKAIQALLEAFPAPEPSPEPSDASTVPPRPGNGHPTQPPNAHFPPSLDREGVTSLVNRLKDLSREGSNPPAA